MAFYVCCSMGCQSPSCLLKPPRMLQMSVCAVGLNFRDVLNVLGMYPGDPGPPGGDCAGIVTAVGDGEPYVWTCSSRIFVAVCHS